jgi:hypothetical protein
MARKQVKRTLVTTKKGVVAYYFEGGKRISEKKGKKKWIKDNFESLDKPYSKNLPTLTANEQKTFKRRKAQVDLFTYKGKKIKKLQSELLKATGTLPSDSKIKEITQLKDDRGNQLFRTFGEFEQAFEREKRGISQTQFESFYGAAGYRGRTENESAISVLDSLAIIGYDGWKLVVVTEDGEEVRGLENGMEAIREFEEYTLEDLEGEFSNLAGVSFRYVLNWDFNQKEITIFLEDTDVQERTSEPKGKKK